MQIKLRKLWLAFGIAALALVGCNTGNDDDDSTTSVTTTTLPSQAEFLPDSAGGCLKNSEGGCKTLMGKDVTGTIEIPRYYYVRPPKNTTGTPGLLVILHGFRDTQDFQLAYFQARELADKYNYVIVAPRGKALEGPVRTGAQAWNASAACCYFDKLLGQVVPDDVDFVSRVIDKELAANQADAKRVVLMGYSNGGFLAHRMACEVSAKVSAIVSLSGVMRRDVDQCQPENPVSVFQIHGTLDTTIYYSGGTLNQDNIPGIYTRLTAPSAPATVNRWASLNGCDASPKTAEPIPFATSEGLVEGESDKGNIQPHPDFKHETPRTATLATYSNCKNNTGVQFLTFESTHQPFYIAETQLKLVGDFINQYGTRKVATVSEKADSAHLELGDSESSSIVLSGANQVPAIATSAYGSVTLTQVNSNELAFQVNVFHLNPEEITAMHIHAGAPGTNGPVVVPIYDAVTKVFRFQGTSLFGRVSFDPSKFNRNDPFYFNLHTNTNKGGELRGPITWGNAPFTLQTALSGLNEPQQLDGTASGTAKVFLDGAGRISFNVTIHQINGRSASAEYVNSEVTMMHIHRGKAGVNGPIVIGLHPIPDGLPNPDDYNSSDSFFDTVRKGGFQFTDGPNGTSVSGFAYLQKSNANMLEELMANPGDFYLNVHSKTIPSGVMRGQLGY